MADGEIIFGRQPVLECLKSGRREFYELLLAEGLKRASELDALRTEAATHGVKLLERPRAAIDALAAHGNHQGVVLRCGRFPYGGLGELISSTRRQSGHALVLVLDHVQDPHNLGALLRTAESVGVSGVLLPTDRAAGVTPVAVRASAGASEHLNVVRLPNLVQAMKKLQKEGLWFTGLEAGEGSRRFTEIDLTGDVGIVVGGEGKGIGRLVKETCDFLAALPMRGRVTSLNASVAGGILLYEVLRQQGASPGRA